jgi:hypothetical protein
MCFTFFAYRMQDQGMGLLNASAFVAVDDQRVIGPAKRLTTILAKQRDAYYAAFAGNLQRRKQVGRIAARTEANQHISRTGQGSKLAGKDFLIPKVIRNARERAWVGVEADCGERAAIAAIAPHKLLRKVNGIGGAAAIAAGVDRVTIEERISHHRDNLLHLVKLVEQRLNNADGFCHLVAAR